MDDVSDTEGLHRTRGAQRALGENDSSQIAEPPQKKPNLNQGTWSATSESLLWSWPRRVDEIAQVYGECIGATDDAGSEITWSQLAHMSKTVAKALRSKGLTANPASAYPSFAGETVVATVPMVVMLGHNVQALAIILGVLRQGYPLLPLSIMHADRQQLLKRYKEAMELFRPAAIISDSPLAQHLVESHEGVEILSPEQLLTHEASSHDYEDVPTTLDHVLAYIFTSGSSGQSKCVTATNRMSWAEVQWYPQIFQKLGVKIDPRKDRWRNDHEMGWWGAAYFGEIDVALAMQTCIVMMKPNDADVSNRGVTLMGALPSQLQNLWPGANNAPTTLRVIFSWAERCDVDLGQTWKNKGVKMADLLIASEFWLTLASCNLELARGSDGRAAHAMRALQGANVHVLDDTLRFLEDREDGELTGMIGIGGPQVSPGYAERIQSGLTVIGSGELSRDGFKFINGEWIIVPKDIVKKRSDGSYLSVGRGGGTVKVRGGVLVATNVVENQLLKGPIVAACITDPLHVEGGSCVVLQSEWRDAWSLRESLQEASFLRMPILFVCEMPRNQSTGKVQKALLHAALEKEQDAEVSAAEELQTTQRVQLDWYARLTVPVLLICVAQPLSSYDLFTAVASLRFGSAITAISGFLTEAVIRWCLVAWVYTASAHAGNLSKKSATLPPVVVIASWAASASGGSWIPLAVPLVLTLKVIAFSLLQKAAGEGEGVFAVLRRVDRLGFSVLIALLSRLLNVDGVTSHFCKAILSIIALNRCLPAAAWNVGYTSFIPQRILAAVLSFAESARYMASLSVVFLLGLPSLVLSNYSNFAWARLRRQGQPLPHEGSSWPYSGPRRQLGQVRSQVGRDGHAWIDVKGDYQCETEAVERPAVQAETPAGASAQVLARQAGVDFQSTDSLKISRLSVLIRKNLKQKPDEEALEFSELREACSNEQSFVSLIDKRMVVSESCETAKAAKKGGGIIHNFLTWAQGGVTVHREGATQAPWDCQVDMLVEWQGDAPLDHEKFCSAYNDVVQQHPMLRARPPPDDKTDADMGTGRNDFMTTAASVWTLLTAVWSQHGSWSWRISKLIRWIVSTALWQAWPRTLVINQDPRYRLNVGNISKDKDPDEWNQNIADEVHGVLGQHWHEFWSSQSSVNSCLVTLHSGDTSRQFLFCSITHKYADGGSVGAFVQALGESYDRKVRGERLDTTEHPVLRVQQQRLKRYLAGETCPQGSLDVYLFDINHDIFYHDIGHSTGAYFTDNVCNVMRTVGLRLACSEEIAWLACITCAMCRLMPDEKLIKILMVHNGRIGEAEGAVACVSQYVMLSIPCANDRSNTPLADIASRVKHAITHGKFTRPAPCEQAHAKINIGGMAGKDGNFSQIFKTHRCKKGGTSRAPHVIQLRMDNEGGTWTIKDFKCLGKFDGKQFWEMTVCAGLEIADGWYNDPLSWN